MEYKVKITASNGDIITLGHDDDGKTTLSTVDIKFDTIDDEVVSKGDGMLAKISIKGLIKEVPNDSNTKQLISLFNWAKSNDYDELYRKVEIEIWNNSNRLRYYSFEKMFVVDYREEYTSTNNGSEFALDLTQLEKEFDGINTFE